MKNYQIEADPTTPNKLLLINNDENPIIKTIQINTFHKTGNRKSWCVEININNETTEMRNMFHTVPETYKTLEINHEAIIARSFENIINFFEIIQKIDPIPTSALTEIMSLIDFDLSNSLDLLKQKLEQGNHQGALQLALEKTKKGDQGILQAVANFYQEKDDINNYINTLFQYPSTHPLFMSANNLIHEYLLTLEPQNKGEKITLLERKLRSVLNLEDTQLATHYFNELCGGDGINHIAIDNVKGDPDTLIKIACQQRSMYEELQQLRTYKTEKEKKLDTTQIDNSNQTQSYKFF